MRLSTLLPEDGLRQLSVRHDFQIRYYGRYCDDLLLQYDRPDRLHELVRGLSSRLAPVCTIDIVDHDPVSLEMLAFRIHADHDPVRFVPRRIDSAVPISCRSAHPKREHDWPLRYMRNVENNRSLSLP